jgi:DNA-binding transcriptional LysR family regulator
MNVNAFDLNLLKVFNAVESERNVSRAAARIGLSQPAMSNALSRLRIACGDKLFVKSPKGMEPTVLALEIAGPVREALSILEGAMGGHTEFDPRRMRRKLRILMSDAGQMTVLPALMRGLAVDAPGVSIEAVSLPRNRFIEALQTGVAELAVSHLTTDRSDIYAEPFFSDAYCCIAAKGHPAINGEISLRQFADSGQIEVSIGNAEPHIDRELTQRRLKRSISLTVAQYSAAINIVRNTQLIATVPRRALRGTDGLQILASPLPLPKAQVRLLWHARLHREPANVWLRKYLKNLMNTRAPLDG